MKRETLIYELQERVDGYTRKIGIEKQPGIKRILTESQNEVRAFIEELRSGQIDIETLVKKK